MIAFLISLLNFLSKLFDQLNYIEGLIEEKKSPENQCDAEIEKLNKALVDRDSLALAAIIERLRPDKGSSDSGFPRSGPSSP